LDEIKTNNYLSENFYFTGGTALSLVYLQHRESVDLDFFSGAKFDNEIIFGIVSNWAEKHKFTLKSRFLDPVYRFTFQFPGSEVKVNFSHYHFKQLRKPEVWKGLRVDSETDIAVNKLFTLNQRVEVKDYIDLYYLLQKYSFWDLKAGVHNKFHQDIEPYILANDFLVVKDFEFLPKMLKPLTLDELKDSSLRKQSALEGWPWSS